VSTAEMLQTILKVAATGVMNSNARANTRVRERCQRAAPGSGKSQPNLFCLAPTSAYLNARDKILEIFIYAYCSAIHRANSWSRMQITLDMFQMLCTSSMITPKMLDLIRGMRYKLAPEDEHYMNSFYDVECVSKTLTQPETESRRAPENDLGFRESSLIQHHRTLVLTKHE
jgi:hypothetical protein